MTGSPQTKAGRTGVTRKAIVVVGALGAMLFSFAAGVYVGSERGIPFVKQEYEWSIAIYEGASPFTVDAPQDLDNPVLTAAHVTDIPAQFVADPFMLQDDGTWYMFFEVLNKSTGHGDVGLATSSDARSWTYRRIVLDEPFHLSYPYVFKWQDRYFMLPETSQDGSLRLYEAVAFPNEWRLAETLMSGHHADPSLVRYRERWWLFSQANPSPPYNILRVYFADDLHGPWTEHPDSPVVAGDGNIARPGGRLLVIDDRVFRFAQDCEPRYGNRLRAFEITALSPDAYREVVVPMKPVLGASGHGWNAVGMHHIDAHRVGENKWIACVDGHQEVKVFGLRY